MRSGTQRSPGRAARGAAGFTLIELLVALAVTVLVLVGVLIMFDFNNKLARAQTNLAEMQQSVRVAQGSMLRTVRMAGRGKLPVGNLPQGVAIGVCNNAQVDPACARSEIATGFTDSPTVVPGSDVLTVRGIFSAPIWQINHTDSTTFAVNASSNPITGTLRITSISHTGVPQATEALVNALTGGDPIPEALLLTSPLDDQIFAVIEVDPLASDVSDPDNLLIGFKYSGGENTDAYQQLTGGAAFPSALTSVAFAGILEEYRYYIRAERAIPGDDTSELRPRLSVARMFPGSEVPYAASLQQAAMDIADNILDLQVALGIDLNADGAVPDTAAADDEWLFNHEDDDEDPMLWNPAGRKLSYLRISTLARTERPDWQYVAEPIAAIEDRLYNEPAAPADETERQERMFRRRVLGTIVDMRNL